MDKYIKRIQARVNRQGLSVSKEQVRTAYKEICSDWDNPSEVELTAVADYLLNNSTGLTVSEIEITPEAPGASQNLQPCLDDPEETAIAPVQTDSPAPLAKPEPSSIEISPTDVTQAINQAIAQVGASGNAEACQMLTTLATELSTDIKDVQEMASALVAAYLNKRKNVLSSTIGTLNQLRTAQTESFQSGLTQDFFGQKQDNKQTVLSTIHALFN